MSDTIIPELEIELVHDRAVEIAQALDGLRTSDAVEILDNAKIYVLKASRTVTKAILLR